MSFHEKASEYDRRSKVFKKNLNNSKILHKSFPLHIEKNQKEKLDTTETTNKKQHCPSHVKFSEENLGSPNIIGWRRALPEDRLAIEQLHALLSKTINSIFPMQNISELIENRIFSMVQLDSRGKLVSFIAYDTYPNIPAVPAFCWEEWLFSKYRLKNITPRNVFFIHYMVWQPFYADQFFPLLLETTFTEYVYLKYIILVNAPLMKAPFFCEKFFVPVIPTEDFPIRYTQSLLICFRCRFFPDLLIRYAFETEFERVIGLIKNYVAIESSEEEIMKPIQTKEKKALICELGGYIAGIMVLNLNFDLELLNEAFELAPFNGLKKRAEEEDKFLQEVFPEKKESSAVLNERRNFVHSSEFLFGELNWNFLLKKSKSVESLPQKTASTDSDFSTEGFSDFSLFRTSSLNVRKSKSITEVPSNSLTSHSRNMISSKGLSEESIVKFKTALNSTPYFYLPKYHGATNAFFIEYFTINCNTLNEKTSSFQFLEAAFKLIPDREYCVLIIPTDFLPFPLLDFFVRVPPKMKKNIKQEVYVCHKNSILLPNIKVRDTEKKDLKEVLNFLKSVQEYDSIYLDILNCCFRMKKEFRTFILTVDEKIVGVSLLDFQDYEKDFQKHFNISNYVAGEWQEPNSYPLIRHILVNPIYYTQARFFIRDIMRLTDSSCLYYVTSQFIKDQHHLLSVLGELVPVTPKRKVGVAVSIPRLPIFNAEDHEVPFSLYLINTRLCGCSRFHLNIVIVIVGASQTALSFLETLIFGPTRSYVNYNNLICITPHPLETEDQELKELMIPVKDNYSSVYTSMLSLATYVTFVYGVMTEINRSKKYIVVGKKEFINYDYLILTCGLQFEVPVPKAKQNTKGPCQKSFRGSLARFLNVSEKKQIPKHLNNIFIINTCHDAKNVFRTLQLFVNKQKNNSASGKKIIIYGHDIQAFLTIHTFLKLGVPGELIAFVEPFPSDKKMVTLFNDPSVDQAVLGSVKRCKVNYYPEFFMYDWTVSPDDFVNTITFHSNNKYMTLHCFAFFPFVEKRVSDTTYNACHKAGLLYDSRLVIDHNFRTSDDFIYAAGPFTKYARRYYADDQDHHYYNSREIGKKLANIITEKIDASIYPELKEKKIVNLVPRFNEPLTLHCQLPENYNLFILRKPGKELDFETAYNLSDYGEVLITGDCQMSKGYGYFRLHLDSEGCVESITCYTKDKIDYMNLTSLYGLHEKLLNNLLVRFDLALIRDFYSYFRESWATALFHEDFHKLRKLNYDVFLQKFLKDNKESFSEIVTQELSEHNWKSLSQILRQKTENEYYNSVVEYEVKHNLLQFIWCYQNELPAYYSMSQWSKMDNEDNNLYT